MRALVVCTLLCSPTSLALASPTDNSASSPSAVAPVSAIADAALLDQETLPERVRTAIKMTLIERGQAASSYATHAISRDDMCNTMAKAAQEHDLPVAFFTSLIWRESAFKSHAVSPVGAQGVAQFMPWVAARMGLDNPFDPREALPMSAKLLRTLLEQFKSNFGLAAAAYNAGPKRVVDWVEKRGKLPKETRDYVQIITGRSADQWRKARAPDYAFRTPAGTRCHIVASRPAADGFADVANIPLPPRRPGTEVILVAETTGSGGSIQLASAETRVVDMGVQRAAASLNVLPRPRPVTAAMGGPLVPVKSMRVAARASPRSTEVAAAAETSVVDLGVQHAAASLNVLPRPRPVTAGAVAMGGPLVPVRTTRVAAKASPRSTEVAAAAAPRKVATPTQAKATQPAKVVTAKATTAKTENIVAASAATPRKVATSTQAKSAQPAKVETAKATTAKTQVIVVAETPAAKARPLPIAPAAKKRQTGKAKPVRLAEKP